MNAVREVWGQGACVINGWVSSGSPLVAELLSLSGFDSVTVDLQHGFVGMDGALAMLQAISHGHSLPMARCASNDLGQINKLLDAGAEGIICPLVDTAEDCRRFVEACRYPPAGRRSFGPTRPALLHGAGYFAAANSGIVTLAMIETRQGLENVDAILTVAGLDGLFVGPSDLAIALGEEPGAFGRVAVVDDAVRHILARSKAAGRAAGIFCGSAEQARTMREAGFDLVTPGHDIAFLRSEATRRIGLIRG